MPARFRWITFDVTDLLPQHWQQEVVTVASEAEFRDFPRTPLLTREAAEVQTIPRGRAHAPQVRSQLPWLYELYHSEFLELINQAWPEPVVTAADDRYGVVLNVQRGTDMRFEAHVDSNPVSGVLFCTDHPEGGGELVISHDSAASGIVAIERDRAVIRPHAGHLLFFDGRDHPHYARPLTAQEDMRVLAVMNYYTRSFPESTRPRELNRHLYGDPHLSGYAPIIGAGGHRGGTGWLSRCTSGSLMNCAGRSNRGHSMLASNCQPNWSSWKNTRLHGTRSGTRSGGCPASGWLRAGQGLAPS